MQRAYRTPWEAGTLYPNNRLTRSALWILVDIGPTNWIPEGTAKDRNCLAYSGRRQDVSNDVAAIELRLRHVRLEFRSSLPAGA